MNDDGAAAASAGCARSAAVLLLRACGLAPAGREGCTPQQCCSKTRDLCFDALAATLWCCQWYSHNNQSVLPHVLHNTGRCEVLFSIVLGAGQLMQPATGCWLRLCFIVAD